eukprot:2531039-Amphidinium_carterae.1
MNLTTAAQGFALCWNRGSLYTHAKCCTAKHYASGCFDSIYTHERCCEEADDDPFCWQKARHTMQYLLSSLLSKRGQAESTQDVDSWDGFSDASP